jgi:hypothetical protein
MGGMEGGPLGDGVPARLANPASLRPRTAFIWPHATIPIQEIPTAFQEIVGRHCLPDFNAARRHALFGGQ